MASNNTDWDYGESRNSNDVIIPAKLKVGTSHSVRPGSVVRWDAGYSGDEPIIVDGYGSSDSDAPCGVVVNGPRSDDGANTLITGGQYLTIMTRGITRIRMVTDGTNGAIALGGPGHVSGGKIANADATSGSKSFGISIGGALANGDTGLWFIDCWSQTGIPTA